MAEEKKEPSKKKGPPKSRRNFFGELFGSIAAPLIEVADDHFKLGLKDLRDVVRPPGALPESQFLDKCAHSGYCVEACPVKAIIPLPEHHPGRRLGGTPVVLAETQPCVMCYDLACLSACPTGAIRPLNRDDVRMGTARWRSKTCLRPQGEDCRICVEKCPLGERVIGLDPAGGVAINPDACTGCGVCVFYCPTEPKAIVVEPA